jgi:hypothetical protein
MRSVAALAATMLVALACGGGSTGHIPSPIASSAATASPSASPSSSPVASYGLLLTAGTLEMITPSGTIAAHATVAAPSAHTCGRSTAAVRQPPVSASDNKVYYRDGNTKIKFLTPDGQTGNVTTVPGSASKVSFFSVSPDDTRIAVLVEDLSPATTIKLSLYVEDLTGHTNHSVIFTNTIPKYKNGNTLWPMGWHQGLLALALWPPCTFESAGMVAQEWHVANATTGVRVAKIGNPCMPSNWPSPAGLACVDLSKQNVSRYNWAGNVTGGATAQGTEYQSGLSPSGRSMFFTPGIGIGNPPPSTRIVVLGTGGGSSVQGHSACLWIDEDHLLAPDAVITFPSATAGQGTVTSTVIALSASGECAGRFPGGL